jgi:hypothetical protein
MIIALFMSRLFNNLYFAVIFLNINSIFIKFWFNIFLAKFSLPILMIKLIFLCDK